MTILQASNPSKIIWLAVTLAILTAAAYLLIGLNVLPEGDLQVAADGGIIVYLAAGCYLLGGLLILARRNWLWVIGLLINALVVLFFFRMYQARPAVMFSAGGLVTKIAQILLEGTFAYLIVKNWLGSQR